MATTLWLTAVSSVIDGILDTPGPEILEELYIEPELKAGCLVGS